MVSFRSHKGLRNLTLGMTLAVAAAVFLYAPYESCQSAHASDIFPSDYCYRTDIAITYSGAGTQENVPVRVEMNAQGMVNQAQVDERAWDIKPIQGALTNEVHLTAQEMDSSTSPWWIVVPSIGEDETRIVRAYSGNPEQRRDQGVYFTGGEYVEVPIDPLLVIRDDLRIDIRMTNFSEVVRENSLVSRWVPGFGYKVRFDGSGAFRFAFDIDNSTCNLNWDSAWTDEPQVFSFRYTEATGADAFIYRNGVLLQSCDLDEGQIGNANQPFVIGATSLLAGQATDVAISDVRVWDDSTEIGHWGFDASAMTETVSTNPYQGTVQDYSVNDLDGTYTFDRDQADFTYSVGQTQFTLGAAQVTLPDANLDILGPAFGINPGAVIPESQSGIFYDLFLGPIADASPVRAFGFAAGLSSLGWILAIITLKATRYVPLALFIWGLPLAAGVPNGWISPYWMILWVVFALGGWLAQRQAEAA